MKKRMMGFAVAITLALTACGGNGTTSTTENNTPTASETSQVTETVETTAETSTLTTQESTENDSIVENIVEDLFYPTIDPELLALATSPDEKKYRGLYIPYDKGDFVDEFDRYTAEGFIDEETGIIFMTSDVDAKEPLIYFYDGTVEVVGRAWTEEGIVDIADWEQDIIIPIDSLQRNEEHPRRGTAGYIWDKIHVDDDNDYFHYIDRYGIEHIVPKLDSSEINFEALVEHADCGFEFVGWDQ